jgi:ribosomal protein S21
MGIRLVVGEGEPLGTSLRRFKRLVEQAGVLYYTRKRLSGYQTPGQVRRWKKGAARDRAAYWETLRRAKMGLE